MVLVHTAMGLVFVLPYTWYQVRHWLMYRRTTLTHVKLTGYLSLVATTVCGVSGIVLTLQAAFSTGISSAWDLAHILSTFALVAFAMPHVVALVLRNQKRKDNKVGAQVVEAEGHFGWGTLGLTTVLFAVVGLWTYAYEPVVFRNIFPPDYSFMYGGDRPFRPSLANTETGGAFDARSLSGSQSCGTAGCHEQILKEWEPSAHRYSAMDLAFQKVQEVMAKQNGAESTRYCGGCHDPISLFSGTKNIFVEDLTSLAGQQEGISCLGCHAIRETDVKGNANYVIGQPTRYAYEMKNGEMAQFLLNFLMGENSGLTAPITTISEKAGTILVGEIKTGSLSPGKQSLLIASESR